MPAVSEHGLFLLGSLARSGGDLEVAFFYSFCLCTSSGGILAQWLDRRSIMDIAWMLFSDMSLLGALYCFVRSGDGFLLPTLLLATLNHFSLKWPQWVCTAGQMGCTVHTGGRNLCLVSHVHEGTMHAATHALLHTGLLAAWRHVDLESKLWKGPDTAAARRAAACPSRSECTLSRIGDRHFHMRRCGVCR